VSQTKLHSHLEASTNLATGFILSLIVWHFLALYLEIPMPLDTNLFITGVFTVVSYIRSYLFRRLFNWITTK
jgi:hypothetical protein